MQATSITCPNCGAGLGPPDGGQYVCAYCGQRSVAAASSFDAQQRAATLDAALAAFEARRARTGTAVEELRKRAHDVLASSRRENGFVMLGIGGLFLLFALGCFAGAAISVISAGGLLVTAGIGVFGVSWLALGGPLGYIGLRYMRDDRRDRRLRLHGLRGRAVVLSYRETRLVVDGNPKYDLVLRVELPRRSPFKVRQSDYVVRSSAVTTGEDLPVFVDPSNTNDVMIDWLATW